MTRTIVVALATVACTLVFLSAVGDARLQRSPSHKRFDHCFEA